MQQTHDIKIAENLSPKTRKLEKVNESIKRVSKVFKKSDVEDVQTQTPAIQKYKLYSIITWYISVQEEK